MLREKVYNGVQAVENHDGVAESVDIDNVPYGSSIKLWTGTLHSPRASFHSVNLNHGCWDGAGKWSKFPKIGTVAGPGGKFADRRRLQHRTTARKTTTRAKLMGSILNGAENM